MATERKNIKRNKTRRNKEERAYYPSIQRTYGKIKEQNNAQTKLF